MHEKGWKTGLFGFVNNGLLLIIGLATIFPIYYTVILSFTDPVEYYQRSLILWPRDWTLDAYKHLLSNGLFVTSISISVFLATVGTMLSLLVTGGWLTRCPENGFGFARQS